METYLNKNVLLSFNTEKPSPLMITRNGYYLGFIKMGEFNTKIVKDDQEFEVHMNDEYFDDLVNSRINTDEKFIYLEGEKNIYAIDKKYFNDKMLSNEFSIESMLSVFNSDTYSPDLEMSDEDMDTLL